MQCKSTTLVLLLKKYRNIGQQMGVSSIYLWGVLQKNHHTKLIKLFIFLIFKIHIYILTNYKFLIFTVR